MPLAPPTQVFGGTRFYEAPPWRMIAGDLEDNTLTFLDRLALDRSVTVTRAAARVISGRVPSDNPEVNIPAPPPDDEAFVSEGIRLVSCFRREAPAGSNEAPWVIRARGIILGLTDDADTDHATSTFTAYDPWKYLYRRPVLNPATGSALGDVSYVAGTRASDIIVEQLQAAIDYGGTIFTDFGQTAFYTGTIEPTEPLPNDGDGLAMTFRSGTTIGEMLDLLVATGTCDVVFDPIYDVTNRPGLLCQLSVYEVAGQYRGNAIFAWDRWPGSLIQLSRQVEGTERANKVQMYAGQGGPPVPEEDDLASLARFGEYWALQYLPGVPSLAGAHTIAQRQLALLKDGQYTYALSPAAERAPLLFEEYREADTIPVYASNRFRDPISGVPVRVESIPIVIGDDELERVNQMLVSFAPVTTNVMKANATSSAARVDQTFAVAAPDFWLTFDMAIPAAAFAEYQAGTKAAWMVALEGDPSFLVTYELKAVSGNWDEIIGTVAAVPIAPPSAADTWMHCECHRETGGASQFYIDGTLILNGTAASAEDTIDVQLGLTPIGGTSAHQICYFRNVKMGTTRGASDIFSDDFSSGDLSAWSVTIGNVTVVKDPFA